MSKRPIAEKKRRRVAKTLRRAELPRYFDIVQWLLDHEYATTKRQARELLLADKVRSNSHPLGTEVGLRDGKVQKLVNSRVPIAARADIIVSA